MRNDSSARCPNQRSSRWTATTTPSACIPKPPKRSRSFWADPLFPAGGGCAGSWLRQARRLKGGVPPNQRVGVRGVRCRLRLERQQEFPLRVPHLVEEPVDLLERADGGGEWIDHHRILRLLPIA